ncbi:MAG: SDR family oxidoreductase [Chitinophagales bacterium]
MPTVLILGATSDIGIAIANKFAANGFAIQLAARRTEQLKSIQSDISIRHHVSTQIYSFDATLYADHQRFFDGLVPKPDIVCCVFGLMEEENLAFEQWELTERMIATNYTGAVSVLNIIGRYFAAQKKGLIIGISSVAGERGRKSKLIYGSAKSAFSAYLAGLRNLLFEDQVHVMTVKPGFVYTRMTENIHLPKILTATAAQVADAIYGAAEKKKNTIYVKWFWRYIMTIIKLIPEFLFKKMNL